MMLHHAANRSCVQWTAGQRHPVAEPVHVIRIEIAADQLRSWRVRRFSNQRLNLLNPLVCIDSCIQMRVPKPQIATGRPHCGGKCKAAPGTGAKIVLLQAPNLNILNWMTADDGKPLIVYIGSCSRKRLKIPQVTRNVTRNICLAIVVHHFLQKKQVRLPQMRRIVNGTQDFANIPLLRDIQGHNRKHFFGSGLIRVSGDTMGRRKITCHNLTLYPSLTPLTPVEAAGFVKKRKRHPGQ